MTSSYRIIERLPVEIFENLVHRGDDEDEDETSTAGTSSQQQQGLVLQRRICNKLKSFPRKIAGRNIHKAIKQVGDFLKISDVDLVHGLDPLLTFAECRELRRRICELCAAKPFTLRSVLHRPEMHHGGEAGSHAAAATSHLFIPSGITVLDRQLQGGFRVGTITEIFGRAGSGKTQLAMQICLETVKRGMAAAFLETEGKFSMERLHEMALAISSDNESPQYNDPTIAAATVSRNGSQSALGDTRRQKALETMSQILLYSATNVDELRGAISAVEIEACIRTEPEENAGSITECPVGIIVLDSIAAPARRDFGKGDGAARAQSLMQFARSLKRLAETLKLAVVVINQIGGTAFRPDNKTDEEAEIILDTAGALGNSWHHCASTRLLVECTTTLDAVSNDGRTRQITVTKSSYLKRGSTTLLYLGRNGFKDPS
uniref:RecA family profile 1 domain-containing protein n=1 Tax=Amphora coffeiformis TaxID=265554 RepID=A0A7S3P7N4_9STRA|mmetsp:Transcript_19618/g.37104  ORF Transcript_19618/g.37104 Transcript_19618/m.37104 type:complete len:433 (+) Transcript_19618:57-1355(+)